MLKNVILRDANKKEIDLYQTFPTKESEWPEMIRKKWPPGRYYITYNTYMIDDETGRKTGVPRNRKVYVHGPGGAQPFAGGGSGLAMYGNSAPSSVDLTIYRELILPMATQIIDKLNTIESMLADLFDGDDDAEEVADMNGDTTTTKQPEQTEQGQRLMQAVEDLKNGVPLPELMAKYADLLPMIMENLPKAKA